MTNSKVVPVEEAVGQIPDGALITVCGAWLMVPELTLKTVEDHFLKTGHPRDLTVVYAICPGGLADQPAINHFAHPGLLRRVIGGSFPNDAGSPLRRMVECGEVEAYNLPSGMITQWLREVGSGRAGALTRIGLGTFVDPRQTGGRMNARTKENILSVVTLNGQEHLFLPSARVDVSIIRATTADEAGNLTMEQEAGTLTSFVQAQAARASGGRVIAQVKRITQTGTLKPHAVKTPGSLVDFVVVDPDQIQASGIPYDPALSGEIRMPLRVTTPGSEVARQMVRRAAREIRDGDMVVLGYGLSAYVPYLLLEEGRFDRVTFAIEQGSIGGLPLTEFGFGSSFNPTAILDAASQFDMFQGGCFDLAMLSFLQVDEDGRVNVHRLDSRPHLTVGIGGFADIAGSARKIVFVGYFTAGGLQVEVADGALKIVREGTTRKFVRRVPHVSFAPEYSRAQEIVYVTERAVFRRVNGDFFLKETMPGVDVKRDVLDQMEFRPIVR